MTNKANLRERSFHSAVWVVLGHSSSQGMRLLSNLVMTRLLVPEMFGVMALVTVFMIGFSLLSDVGLQQNVVQSKDGDNRDFLDTAWLIQILRGIVIYVLALISSGFLIFLHGKGFFPPDSVYANASLPFLLAVMAFIPLINGFNSINLMQMSRKLTISKLIKIELISQIVGLIFMVSIALFWREIWVLAIAGLITAVVKLALSHHKTMGPRMRFIFKFNFAKDIFHFGKWIMFGSILGFLLSQGDRILLGAWLSPEMLGIYSIAFLLSNAVIEIVNKLVGYVFYPVLSEIFRETPKKMQESYYRIRFKVDLITMTIAGILVSSGSKLIYLLYDSRYFEAAWMFEILSISIIFIGYNIGGAFLMARGNSKSHAQIMIFPILFLYIGLPISFSYFGFFGAVICIAIVGAAKIPITFYLMRAAGILDIKRELATLPIFFVIYVGGLFFMHLAS